MRSVCGPVDVDDWPLISAFRPPWWAAPRGIGARIGGRTIPTPAGALSTKQAKEIILANEARLIARLLESLLDAYRKALITVGMSPSSSSKPEPPIAPMQEGVPPQAHELQEQAGQAPAPQAPTQEEVQQKRASDIVRAQREVAGIRDQMGRDDDYDRLKAGRVAHPSTRRAFKELKLLLRVPHSSSFRRARE